MKPGIRAALFDMDGTLINSMPYWRISALEYMVIKGMLPNNEELSRLFDVSGRALCAEVFARHGVHLTKREIMRDMEAQMAHHYRLDVEAKPDVDAYLSRLRALGLPMAIATATPCNLADEVLRRLGLRDYFEFIADGYMYDMTKEDPAYFRLMAERLGTTTDALCVFEDSLYAVESAKVAGCHVVAIADEIAQNQREAIRAAADEFYESYAELLCTV